MHGTMIFEHFIWYVLIIRGYVTTKFDLFVDQLAAYQSYSCVYYGNITAMTI